MSVDLRASAALMIVCATIKDLIVSDSAQEDRLMITDTWPSQPGTWAYAQGLDQADPLAAFRERFVIHDPDLIYLDGNSLGRLPQAAVERLTTTTQEWGGRLVRGWNEGWLELPQRLGGKLAGLIGADPDEVLIADATSVNLFKLLTAFLQHQRRTQPQRRRVVTDRLNFPSDLYVVQGVLDLLEGWELAMPPDEAGADPAEQIIACLGEDVALVTLSHTTFKSGYTYDMARLTAAAQAAGAIMLWDLSHSVGALPIDVRAAQADGAVGCTYKYLNGGPGAPAFLYVRRDWQEVLRNPISGWFGQQAMFDFDLRYTPAAGVRRFATGTPSILALCAIEAGLDLLLEAGMARVRAKSVQQTEYLISLWEQELQPLGFTLNSPRQAERRGSHVALGHPQALGIDLALIHEKQVLPDFRAPDNLRLGLAPLYNRFTDIFVAVQRMREVVQEGSYRRYTPAGLKVT